MNLIKRIKNVFRYRKSINKSGKEFFCDKEIDNLFKEVVKEKADFFNEYVRRFITIDYFLDLEPREIPHIIILESFRYSHLSLESKSINTLERTDCHYLNLVCNFYGQGEKVIKSLRHEFQLRGDDPNQLALIREQKIDQLCM